MMFGDETFPGFRARQQHVMVHRRIKVSIPITPCRQPSNGNLLDVGGSGLFTFARELRIIYAYQHTECLPSQNEFGF